MNFAADEWIGSGYLGSDKVGFPFSFEITENNPERSLPLRV
jgi:hypothetical protein